MNKAYKVVFNEATGTYIAVAEFVTTKKKGGCKSSLKTVASALMLSGALLGANDAMAAASTGGTGDGTVISACTTNTTGSKQASASGTMGVAIGCNAEAGSDSGILDRNNPFNNSTNSNKNGISWSGKGGPAGGETAVGSGASASGGLSTALGTNTKTSGIAAVAIGVAAVSTGNTSLAIGRQSAATNDFAQAIGNVAAATGKGTLAIGHSATATGYRAIAIGSPDIENAAGVGQAGTGHQTVG